MRSKNSMRGLLIGIIIFITVMTLATSKRPNIGECKEYYCDVKAISMRTSIDITKDGEKIAKVSGNVLKFLTDPLTMYNQEGEKIAYANDDYNIISQDDHSIFVNGKRTVEMEGKVTFGADYYKIYDASGKLIATAYFNFTNTYGKIESVDGTLWADYSSYYCMKDYKVRIKDECELDDTSVLMMMASFYSDRAADNSSK